MSRAYETVKPFIEHYNIKVTYDTQLNERILSDLPIDNWLTELTEAFNNYEYRINHGETSSEAQKRILSVCRSISMTENTLIVTHGNIMTLLLNHFDKSFGFEDWKKLQNPDLFSIDDHHKVKHIELKLDE